MLLNINLTYLSQSKQSLSVHTAHSEERWSLRWISWARPQLSSRHIRYVLVIKMSIHVLFMFLAVIICMREMNCFTQMCL